MAAAIMVFAAFCELMVIVGSWIGSAMSASQNITSLLSAEGVRWYIGSFADILATPYLVWIILVGITLGVVSGSGIVDALRCQIRGGRQEFIERLSLNAAEVLAAVIVAVVLFLICAPHAVLLSATGTISDSSFSAGIVPIMAFLFSAPSLVYGLCASKFRSATSIFYAIKKGVTKMVPVIVLYIFVTHLAITIIKIFNI